MGHCLSGNKNNEQCRVRDIEDKNNNKKLLNSNLSQWNEFQVLEWIKCLDLSRNDEDKLLKKFKKYHVDGEKLFNKIDEKILKKKFKINGIALRLELIKAINKERSKYEYQLPQYYPFDYKYNNGNDSNNNYDYDDNKFNDRKAWTIGTVVVIYCKNYEIWCVGKIVEIKNKIIMSSDGLLYSFKEKKSNDVIVAYDLGNGQIEYETINRFNVKRIKSDKRFLKNRLKLRKGCQIEIFDLSITKQCEWRHSYIKNENFNRWSPKIRCSESLLNLTINSELYVYHCLENNYFCAKIIEIFSNDYVDNNKQLDIFKVIYKYNDNNYYFKYIHQFSANILLLNNHQERPSHYTDLEVIIYSNKRKKIKHDLIDQQYTNLLLNGYLRSIIINNNYNNIDFVNIISLLMHQQDYIGPNYQLIIYLENKFWSN